MQVVVKMVLYEYIILIMIILILNFKKKIIKFYFFFFLLLLIVIWAINITNKLICFFLYIKKVMREIFKVNSKLIRFYLGKQIVKHVILSENIWKWNSELIKTLILDFYQIKYFYQCYSNIIVCFQCIHISIHFKNL